MSNLKFEQLRDITGGKIGVVDAACPECGPQRRTTINQRRKVLRVWCDTASFLTYRCARCEIEGHAYDGSAVTQRFDPAVLERAKAKAKERQRIEKIESVRKSRWLWNQRLPI